MQKSRNCSSNRLQLFSILLLILGIYFRFTNLDLKIYWQDEIATSLRISGFSLYSLYQQEFNGNLIGIEHLHQYMGISPDRNLVEVAKALIGNPEHTPLYYLLARFWAQILGYSVGVMRSLPALISLLSFPAMYWLCLELFGSAVVGWVAIALLSVSPIHILYAQEARPYSLWILTILLACAALLRAIRLNTKTSWGLYALILALAFYTHILSGLVALIHLSYILNTQRFRFSRIVKNYLIASGVSILAFLPWILIILWQKHAFKSNIAWASAPYDSFVISKQFLLGLVSLFFDPSGSIIWRVHQGFDNPLSFIIRIPFLVLIGYALYFVAYKRRSKSTFFILTILGATSLTLLFPSLLLGLPIANKIRYQLPFFIGIELAVAYLIATKLKSRRLSQRQIGQFLLGLIIASGVVSCTLSSQAFVWWNKEDGYTNLQVAQILNQAEKPLLISNDWVSNIFALSYLLNSQVNLLLFDELEELMIPEGFTETFFLKLPDNLREKMHREKKYTFRLVEPSYLQLWKLQKSTP